jgi:uncharacterized protein
MNKPFRILSLSGGGIRGIFQAVFLSKIAKSLPSPLWENFDLICGTSTGSIVGMALAMGVDIDRIVDLYQMNGTKIFKKRWLSQFSQGGVYNQDILRDELSRVLPNFRLRDAKTHVLIPSASINNYDHRVFTNFGVSGKNDGNLSVVDVILSSTAAPTYFLPFQPAGEERHYVDGGLWANTPSSLGILFANKYLNIPIGNIKLISIGTGDFPAGATIDYFRKMRQFSPKAILTIFELMFASQSSFADQYAQELLGEDNYLRVSANLRKTISLGDVKSALDVLPGLADAASQMHLSKVKRMLNSSSNEDQYIQKPDRENLISDYLIYETGLTAFIPSRDHYRKHRGDSGSIHTYINSAKQTLEMVSITLLKGINFENLRVVLERKLEDRESQFRVTISFLNPEMDYLISSLAPVFERSKEEVFKDINDGISRLREVKGCLSSSAQKRFDIRVHNAIPFGSAIIIDGDDDLNGRIQIETKVYKAPYDSSFAFEVMRTKKDGYYDTLLKGYRDLMTDGESLGA